MGMYDIGGASAGQASQLQPEERQMQRLTRMVKVAEQTNYDGDPEYYNQIKAIAMQAGIPIKQFKSNPFRAAGIFGASMLDTAMLGLLPNSLYTPEGGHVSGMDEAADTLGMLGGMALPWGAPARLAGGAMKMGGRALAGGALKGGNISKFIQGSPGLMKRMGIQPKGTKATADAAKNLMRDKVANAPLALTTGQAQLPSTAASAGARDVFGGYVPKKSVSVPKVGATGTAQVKTPAQKAADAKAKATKVAKTQKTGGGIKQGVLKVSQMSPKAIKAELKALAPKYNQKGKSNAKLAMELNKVRAEKSVAAVKKAQQQLFG